MLKQAKKGEFRDILHSLLLRERITIALIRLRICTGWSAPLLFASNEVRVSRIEAHMMLKPKSVTKSNALESLLPCSTVTKGKKLWFSSF